MESDFTSAAQLRLAASWLRQADALLICAGAGIGVDSGLPDFRGNQGLWRAYPALQHAGFTFEQIANPDSFQHHPRRAWGFYGHRLQLYRKTQPHQGFHILQRLAQPLEHGYFVLTSNVDGQFQAAGFNPEQIYECHGSIQHLQCLTSCRNAIWSADELSQQLEIDTQHCLLNSPLPTCQYCGSVIRPNVLMFNDWGWLSQRSDLQQQRLSRWLRKVRHPVVIELGAGTHLPTIRRFSESLRVPLIRINPHEPQVDGCPHAMSMATGALAGLQALEQSLRTQSAA